MAWKMSKNGTTFCTAHIFASFIPHIHCTVQYICITVLHNLYIMYLGNIFLSAQNKAEVSYAVHYAVRDAPASLRCAGIELPLYHSILPRVLFLRNISGIPLRISVFDYDCKDSFIMSL